jgi:hypothetical protein
MKTKTTQGTHFWFMSLLVPAPNGFSAYRRSGHFTPEGGLTRHDAFEVLLNNVKEQSPELSESAVVLSFDIQPNQL